MESMASIPGGAPAPRVDLSGKGSGNIGERIIGGVLFAAAAISVLTTIGTILIALGRLIANEERVGITRGHDEIREVVEEALAWLRQPASEDQTA